LPSVVAFVRFLARSRLAGELRYFTFNPHLVHSTQMSGASETPPKHQTTTTPTSTTAANAFHSLCTTSEPLPLNPLPHCH